MAKKSRKKSESTSEVVEAGATNRGKLAWLGAVALVAIVTVLVYLPSLRSEFVSDARLEIDEGFVTSLANLPKVVSLKVLNMQLILSDRPGEMLYLMLNAALWGKSPLGYHLSSVLLHALNAVLLLVLLGRLVNVEPGLAAIGRWKTGIALITAALIFALHPMATESVAEVSYSSNLLVTLFVLLGLLAATMFRPGDRKIALLTGIIGVACAGAATLTKESGIAVALLLAVYWFLFRCSEARTPWILFLLSAMAVTALAIGAIFFLAISDQIKLDYLGGSFGQMLLIQPQLWVFMMGQLLWPTNLAADYTLADMPLPSTPVALIILALVLAAQTWLWRRSRIGALGVATWWLGLATVSNLLPLFCILADRFYYLPLAGLAMQLAAILLLLANWRPAFSIAVGSLWIALPFLVVLTVAREKVFANESALWSDTLKKSPHSSLAHANLGLLYFRQGRLDEATNEFEQAVTVDPKNSTACVCLGFIAISRGQLDDAILQFQRALAIHPQNDDAYCGIGTALCQQGRLAEGIKQFNQALAINPDNANAQINLGLALSEQGQIEPALVQLRKALRSEPNSIKARDALGDTLAKAGQMDPAAEQYKYILRLKPDNVPALIDLGVVYLRQGRFDDAIAQFQQAVKICPDSPDIHDNLGVALAQKGNTAEAIPEFQEALRLKPDFQSAQINLAKAQAAAKRGP